MREVERLINKYGEATPIKPNIMIHLLLRFRAITL